MPPRFENAGVASAAGKGVDDHEPKRPDGEHVPAVREPGESEIAAERQVERAETVPSAFMT